MTSGEMGRTCLGISRFDLVILILGVWPWYPLLPTGWLCWTLRSAVVILPSFLMAWYHVQTCLQFLAVEHSKMFYLFLLSFLVRWRGPAIVLSALGMSQLDMVMLIQCVALMPIRKFYRWAMYRSFFQTTTAPPLSALLIMMSWLHQRDLTAWGSPDVMLLVCPCEVFFRSKLSISWRHLSVYKSRVLLLPRVGSSLISFLQQVVQKHQVHMTLYYHPCRKVML